MIKFFILAIFFQNQVFYAFCGSEEQLKNAGQLVRKTCQPKTKVTVEAIEAMNNRNYPDNDKNLKCYLNCVLEMGQTIKRGKVTYKQALSQIRQFVPENLKEGAIYALDMCKDAPNGQKDPCEAAYTLAKCLLQHNPKGSFP